MMPYRHLLLALLLSAVLWPLPTAAQTDADREAARTHFRRGVQLFDESNYEGARIEFEAAYARTPNYRLLFNIGNVHAALNHAVEAVDAYERYLAQGGASLEPERRAAVQAALEVQRGRIGSVMITSRVEGATVTVDGVDTEFTTPLTAPLRLSIGRYAIGLRFTGYEGPTRAVTVAGGTEQTLEIGLSRVVEARGNMRVESNAQDVQVLVDGEVVGTTPLGEELVVAPGVHEVSGRRLGYRVYRERVTVEDGGVVDVDLRMEIDPAARPEEIGVLVLALPDADATLIVDGQDVTLRDGHVDLPVGRHVMVLNVEEREEEREIFEVLPGAELEITPALQWTDSARGTRATRASNARLIGWVLGLAGVVATGVGLGVLLYGVSQHSAWSAANDEILGPGGCMDRMNPLGGDCTALHTKEVWDTWNSGAGTSDLYMVSGGILFGIGIAATTVGITLLLITDSEEDIDAAASAPSASMRIGPGRVDLVGTF